jgi:hypothetical protein
VASREDGARAPEAQPVVARGEEWQAARGCSAECVDRACDEACAQGLDEAWQAARGCSAERVDRACDEACAQGRDEAWHKALAWVLGVVCGLAWVFGGARAVAWRSALA